MTIEILAQAIHEDWYKAYVAIHKAKPVHFQTQIPWEAWDSMNEKQKAVRLEQARLMFERIMR